MNLTMDGNARIDLINERIIIPICFNNKIDFEGIKEDFDECIETLQDNEEDVLKEFKDVLKEFKKE